jgi:hypothetical protein
VLQLLLARQQPQSFLGRAMDPPRPEAVEAAVSATRARIPNGRKWRGAGWAWVN